MLVLAMALGASKSMFCQFDSRTGRHCFGGGVTRSGPLRRLLERHVRACNDKLEAWAADEPRVRRVWVGGVRGRRKPG